VIVELRESSQAARVAVLTGGTRLPGKTTRRDGTQSLSLLVDVGPDFEAHREAVEQVSVLFTLHDGDAASYTRTGSPGAVVASGWTVTGTRFEVEWPADPDRRAVIRSHFGARRKAFNWALALVKADIDAHRADPAYKGTGWGMRELRGAWNQAKDQVAPWWRSNSKESYASGLQDLADALDNWKKSKDGTRKGKRAGFPCFKSARKDPGRVRFTTGALRLEPDRRTITLPVIGRLRSMENTRRVQRHLASGRARLVNMTLSERWGRLFVSVCYALRDPVTPRVPALPGVRAGVDLGIRVLATVSHLDPETDQEVITEFPNPAPLRATLTERRRAGREMARRVPGSRGWHAARAKSQRLDRRCVHLRQQASHHLTTTLARAFGEIVVEDLDLAAMKRSMGRRAYRRAVSAAAQGRIRPQLEYKVRKHGGTLTVADKWFPSSQLHYGHVLPDGSMCRLAGKGKLDKRLACPVTGIMVDRDANAALNLRGWPDLPAGAQLKAPVPPVSTPGNSAGDGDPDPGTSQGLESAHETTRRSRRGRRAMRPEPEPPNGSEGTPHRGAPG
jgi:putative transposase